MHHIRNSVFGLFTFFFTLYAYFFVQESRLYRPYFVASASYDLGLYGSSPKIRYNTYHRQSIKPNIVRKDDRCDSGLVFVEARNQGDLQPLMVFDNDGNLVWMPPRSEFINARDFEVQNLEGQAYITFLTGGDASGQGESYVMAHTDCPPDIKLDSSYKIRRTIRTAGDLIGHLSGLRITQSGSALIVITQKSKNKICDTIFQEIDLQYGTLLFEWRASQHPFVNERSSSQPFHIQSIDKGTDGNYLISVGDAILCLSNDGNPIWQLGGEGNRFGGFTGAAITLSWDHRASWYSNTTLLITNNHLSAVQSVGGQSYDAAVLVELDLENMSSRVLKRIDIPQKWILSLDRFQLLDNSFLAHDKSSHILVELSDDETLCETHFAPIWLPSSWMPTYRISKFNWTGHPDTLPQIAVKPEENALYVSWNGATDIDSWVLQSGPNKDGNTFIDHLRVPKAGFETRIELPKRTEEYIRVVALDGKWRMGAQSAPVSKHVKAAAVATPSTSPVLSHGRLSFRCQTWALLFAVLSIVAYFCSHTLRHLTKSPVAK